MVVVRRFNEKHPQHRGIPLARLSHAQFPLMSSSDRFHANTYGTYLASFYWYKALCDYDGIPVSQRAIDLLETETLQEKIKTLLTIHFDSIKPLKTTKFQIHVFRSLVHFKTEEQLLS